MVHGDYLLYMSKTNEIFKTSLRGHKHMSIICIPTIWRCWSNITHRLYVIVYWDHFLTLACFYILVGGVKSPTFQKISDPPPSSRKRKQKQKHSDTDESCSPLPIQHFQKFCLQINSNISYLKIIYIVYRFGVGNR